MPYIAIKSDRQETDHRELASSMLVGRAPDCELQIRDILLSRHHCRLEQTDTGWQIADLQSKNGTLINGQRLHDPVALRDNDVIRVGRQVIIFRTGVLEPTMKRRPATPPRPADPSEALAGTLAGFTLIMPGEGEEPPANQPTPQPRPREPHSLERPEVRELLNAIHSSSWDSIYAEASKAPSASRITQTPEVVEEDRPLRRARPRSPVDLTLQALPAKQLPSRTNATLPATDEDMLHVSQEDVARAEAEASENRSEIISARPVRTRRFGRGRINRKSAAGPLSWFFLFVWVAAVATLLTWWSTRTDGASSSNADRNITTSAAQAPNVVPVSARSAGGF